MIYVRANDQDDPHSAMHVEMKGTETLIGHEAFTLMNYIFEQDSDMFHHIVRAVVGLHPEAFISLFHDSDDDQNRKHV